jgi:hypothetical protein
MPRRSVPSRFDDLSNVEVVQMGLVMQEPVMREFARRNQINFKDADYALLSSQREVDGIPL